MSPYLSVIIPAYNEANRLPDSLNRLYHEFLDRFHYPFEVLVADDGSTDETVEMVQTLAPSYLNLRVLSLEHRGKGHAVKHGMLTARGEWRMMADADLAMPPAVWDALIPLPGSVTESLRAFDVLITSRAHLGVDWQHPHRWLGSKAFSAAVRLLTGLPFDDTQSGFKLFHKDAALVLFGQSLVDGFAFDVELLMLARAQGYSVQSVPIEWQNDPDSRVHYARDALKMLKDVAALRKRLHNSPVASRERERAGVP
jgi:dolichyl-phosphate beta-glucosyltransferase